MWGDEICMIALSIVIDKPIYYINVFNRKQIQAVNDNKEDDNELIVTHFEQFNLHQFCIAYANNKQLNNDPIFVVLHNSHYQSLVATDSSFYQSIKKHFKFVNLHEKYLSKYE